MGTVSGNRMRRDKNHLSLLSMENRQHEFIRITNEHRLLYILTNFTIIETLLQWKINQNMDYFILIRILIKTMPVLPSKASWMVCMLMCHEYSSLHDWEVGP